MKKFNYNIGQRDFLMKLSTFFRSANLHFLSERTRYKTTGRLTSQINILGQKTRDKCGNHKFQTAVLFPKFQSHISVTLIIADENQSYLLNFNLPCNKVLRIS